MNAYITKCIHKKTLPPIAFEGVHVEQLIINLRTVLCTAITYARVYY